MKSESIWHSNYWRPRHFLMLALSLLLLNLFSPKGIVHWILLEQESERLDSKIQNLDKEIERVRAEISLFQKSDVARTRAIRNELGYLKSDEMSFEFVYRGPEANR